MFDRLSLDPLQIEKKLNPNPKIKTNKKLFAVFYILKRVELETFYVNGGKVKCNVRYFGLHCGMRRFYF